MSAGWRVHLLLPIDVEGGRFVASRDCVLPSLPPVGAAVAVSNDRDLRPVVEELTCWLDAYAGIRLADVEVWDATVVDRLEGEGWRIESVGDVDAAVDALLGDQ